MARLSWSDFAKALKIANPNLVFIRPRKEYSSPGCMVYLNCPGNPREDIFVEGTKLKELFAIASPSYFRSGCPQKDVVEVLGGNKVWFRGYNNFFRQLLKAKDPNGRLVVRDADGLRRFLPSGSLSRIDCAKFKQEWKESITHEDSELKKKSKWLKSRSKPIAGNGMPLDWKRKSLFSMGGISGGLDYQRV